MLQDAGKTGERAKKLRKDLSLPEVLLWKELQKRPDGLKFRKQHPSGPYVADFYCHEARLIVEIDGEHHDRGDQPEFDEQRDSWFAQRNIAVLRIPAKLVLDDMEMALVTVITQAKERVTPLRPAPSRTPPLAGEVLEGKHIWTL